MLITAPYGNAITSGCGHHVVYGGQWSNDVGQTGDPHGVPIYFNGSGSSEGVIGYVADAGFACGPGSPYGGRVARVDVYEAAFGQWYNTGTIWYAHVENIQTGYVGLGAYLGTVSNGTPSSCWSAPHVHVEWRSNGYFGGGHCYGSFPTLGDI